MSGDMSVKDLSEMMKGLKDLPEEEKFGLFLASDLPLMKPPVPGRTLDVTHRDHICGIHDATWLPTMKRIFENAEKTFSVARRETEMIYESGTSGTKTGDTPSLGSSLVCSAILAMCFPKISEWKHIVETNIRVVINSPEFRYLERDLAKTLKVGVLDEMGIQVSNGVFSKVEKNTVIIPAYDVTPFLRKNVSVAGAAGSRGFEMPQILFDTMNMEKPDTWLDASYFVKEFEMPAENLLWVLWAYLHGEAGIAEMADLAVAYKDNTPEHPVHMRTVAAAIDAGRHAAVSTMVMGRAKRPSGADHFLIMDEIFGKQGSKKTKISPLDEIRGYDEAKEIMQMMSEDLQAYLAGEISWDDAACTALVYGEPGCGKTHLAKALAKSVPNAKAFITSFADWQSSGALGETLAAMRNIFANAIKSKPSVIFIDEIDSLGSRSETSWGRNSGYMRSVINAFLEVMNKEMREGVIVIAACNDVDDLDPAILRDGRFDHKLEIMLPGREATEDILRKNLPETFDIEPLMDSCIGQTPANINGAVRKAKSRARIRKTEMTAEMILKEMSPFSWKRDAVRKRTAAHECGHAIVAAALGGHRVKRLIVRANGGGSAYIEGGMGEMIIDDILSEISILMAGKVAEEAVLGDWSAGIGGSVKSDIARATHLAVGIDARFGLGEGSSLYFDGKNHQWLSDETSRAKAEAIIAKGEERARSIIALNRDLLTEMSDILKTELVMEEDAIEPWLGRVRSLS